MQLGLFGINNNVCARDPGAAVRVAQAAEAAGWESVWTGEHYVLPDPPLPELPARADMPKLEPFVALAHLAAHTRTLRLGTGVTVVPIHHPLMLAKLVASLDRISNGRFLFGVGVGYLEPEFRALGIPLAGRGERTEEYLDAMQAIWTSGAASFDGPTVRFSQVRAEPLPLQRPTPPLHFGGAVPQTFRRAVTRGHGWYGWALDLAATERAVAALRQAQKDYERPHELGPLEISVTPDPRRPLDDTTIAAYADLGVTRLIVLPTRGAQHDADALVAFVEDLGQRWHW